MSAHSEDVAGSGAVRLSREVRDRLLDAVRRRHPRKSFGYLLSDSEPSEVTDFVLFESNIRNDRQWRSTFEANGQYFVAHDDAGFVAAPEEARELQRQIWQRGLTEVGVFHSHRRHPGNFSRIDYDLHLECFDRLWHLIISMRNPERPLLRAFAVTRDGVHELPVLAGAERPDRLGVETAAAGFDLEEARAHLRLDRTQRPMCQDSRRILAAIETVRSSGDASAVAEIVDHGFLRDSAPRYSEHVAPRMRHLAGTTYAMGSDACPGSHFCGESPAHEVTLQPYLMSDVAVTEELFALLDVRRAEVPAAERMRPVTGTTWFDAALFALWMGCRLPTEAEWEYACGAGAAAPWCCEDELSLGRHAWYSQNAGDELHEVGTRAPNTLGLFDLHGDVWEWCADTYDADWYRRSPIHDPVCLGTAAEDRVCRGGSIFSLAEMCRTRFRLHEPPDYHAGDLGFRLARSVGEAGRATRGAR